MVIGLIVDAFQTLLTELGEQEETELWQFLRALPFMPLFQVSIVLTLLGGYVGMWGYQKYIDPTPISGKQMLFGFLYVMATGLGAVIYVCYKDFKSEPRSPVEAIQVLKIELLTVLPLVIAAIVGIYFFAKGQLDYAALVLWSAIAIWISLRIIISRRARKATRR